MTQLPCRIYWIQWSTPAQCDPSERRAMIGGCSPVSRRVLDLRSHRWLKSFRRKILSNKSSLRSSMDLVDHWFLAVVGYYLILPLLCAFKIAYCNCPLNGVKARMMPSFQAVITLLPSCENMTAAADKFGTIIRSSSCRLADDQMRTDWWLAVANTNEKSLQSKSCYEHQFACVATIENYLGKATS